MALIFMAYDLRSIRLCSEPVEGTGLRFFLFTTLEDCHGPFDCAQGRLFRPRNDRLLAFARETKLKKQTQFVKGNLKKQTHFLKGQIAIKSYLKGVYGNNPPCGAQKNKANFGSREA